jgi:dipeptidyl aminopeptidase/acylaminoacyl peptidase
MKSFAFLVICLALSRSAAAITPEEVLSVREVSDLQLSPDGSRVAFVVTEPPDRRSSIWVAAVDGASEPKRIASAASSPRWSPDGDTLAFLDESSQIQLLRGGQSTALTSARGGVEDYQWSPDGKEIAYVVRDQVAENDPIIVDGPVGFARLWIVNVIDGKTAQLTHDDFEISEMIWSPDGRELALVVAPSSKPEDGDRASLIVIDRATGKIARTVTPHVAFAGALRWSPDGRLLTFYDRQLSDPFNTWISVVPAAGGAVRPILKNFPGTVYRIEWQRDSAGLLGEAGVGTHHELLSIDTATGATTELARIISSQWDVGFSTNGRTIAYFAQTPSSPNDVWILDVATRAARKLTDFNPQTRSWSLGAVSEVTWKNSKDGMVRRGVLVTPPGYDPARRYPMVVVAHPGDTAFWTGWLAKWWNWGQLLATHGYVVFLPNYRGVTGEGGRMHAYIGDWGSAFQDLQDGVDALVKRGIADPDRLGIGGWSNGGFMTAFTITHTQRFKAAIAEAAHIDFFSLYGTSYLRDGLRRTLGAPYRNRAAYNARSPIEAITNCRTPTLILHGVNDSGVPIGQAYELYTALKELGVETQMVVYSREGHTIREFQHRLDVQRRALTWFDAHLKP